jgi:hypothetical protein
MRRLGKKKETEKLTPPSAPSPAPSVAVPVFFLGGILFDDGVGFCGLELSENKSRQERVGNVSVWKDGGEKERRRVWEIYTRVWVQRSGARETERSESEDERGR